MTFLVWGRFVFLALLIGNAVLLAVLAWKERT